MLLVLANHPLGEMSIELDAPYTMAYVPDEFDQYVPRNRGRSKTMHMPELKSYHYLKITEWTLSITHLRYLRNKTYEPVFYRGNKKNRVLSR